VEPYSLSIYSGQNKDLAPAGIQTPDRSFNSLPAIWITLFRLTYKLLCNGITRFQNQLSDPSITVDACASERADKIMQYIDCSTVHSKRPSSDQSDPLTQFICATCRSSRCILRQMQPELRHQTSAFSRLALASGSLDSFLR
jgi:hypothetical protein